GGSLGVGAMMLSGIVFDFFDGGETRWDNDGSRDWIRRGAKDCKERFGRKKPVDWGSVTIDFGP
nr:hypothetical protein [Gammaproteobacteria bacterium]